MGGSLGIAKPATSAVRTRRFRAPKRSKIQILNINRVNEHKSNESILHSVSKFPSMNSEAFIYIHTFMYKRTSSFKVQQFRDLLHLSSILGRFFLVNFLYIIFWFFCLVSFYTWDYTWFKDLILIFYLSFV